ncbi:unnamed protein product [Cladocopium goreaui]|uniref:Peptidase n=1 Tax=Cladocopium goreaui TaxID=2562237 RepID=A0A9P1FPK6_9DINO|nr:unnamed protein product [Cladocopium goreaui]
MAAFYDGSSGGPDFTGPKRGLEDCAVCAQDFDAISNLFLFVESDAKCLDDEPPWTEDDCSEYKAMQVFVCSQKFALLAYLCQFATVA